MTEQCEKSVRGWLLENWNESGDGDDKERQESVAEIAQKARYLGIPGMATMYVLYRTTPTPHYTTLRPFLLMAGKIRLVRRGRGWGGTVLTF